MITGSAVATLVLFIISILFVIFPVDIPLRRVGLPHGRFRVDLSTAPIIAIAVLWACNCIGATIAQDVGTDGIKRYNILLLFFCLAYMAITLDITEVLQAVAFWISNRGGSNGRKLYFYFYAMLTDPQSWLIAEFAAASVVLFVGNPTNIVICEGLCINNVTFSSYTVFPFIACIISCFAALTFQFRSTYIPKAMKDKEALHPRSVEGRDGGTRVVETSAVDILRTLMRRAAIMNSTLTSDPTATTTTRQSTLAADPSDTLEPKPEGTVTAGKPGTLQTAKTHLTLHFPTLSQALPRLPFALIPFAFSQFILIEGLAHQCRIDVFARWLVRASHDLIHPTIWLIGVMGVILCSNIAMKRAIESQVIDTPHWWTCLPPEIQVLGLRGRVRNLRRSGFGGYGEIWKGDWTEGGETRKVGVKFLHLRLSEDITRMRLIRELRVWQTVHHAHILQLHGITWHDGSPFPGFVSPWMENGDLGLYLENRPDTTIWKRLTLLWQASLGLRHLHEKGLVHCDIKANNVLVDQDGKAYLSDFGLSRWLDGLQPSMGPCFLSSQLTGPRRWMAPEICNSEPPVTKTFATDIYAFGGLMMEGLTGHPPYHRLSDRAVVGALSDGKHPDRPRCDKPCSIGEVGRCIPVCDEHWKYMEECWSTNPESRPNATALVDQLDRFRVAEHL